MPVRDGPVRPVPGTGPPASLPFRPYRYQGRHGWNPARALMALNPYLSPCPAQPEGCGARPGEPCVNMNTGGPRRSKGEPHLARKLAMYRTTPVKDVADADERNKRWRQAGPRPHQFAGRTTEVFCRACGRLRAEPQHRKAARMARPATEEDTRHGSTEGRVRLGRAGLVGQGQEPADPVQQGATQL